MFSVILPKQRMFFYMITQKLFNYIGMLPAFKLKPFTPFNSFLLAFIFYCYFPPCLAIEGIAQAEKYLREAFSRKCYLSYMSQQSEEGHYSIKEFFNYAQTSVNKTHLNLNMFKLIKEQKNKFDEHIQLTDGEFDERMALQPIQVSITVGNSVNRRIKLTSSILFFGRLTAKEAGIAEKSFVQVAPSDRLNISRVQGILVMPEFYSAAWLVDNWSVGGNRIEGSSLRQPCILFRYNKEGLTVIMGEDEERENNVLVTIALELVTDGELIAREVDKRIQVDETALCDVCREYKRDSILSSCKHAFCRMCLKQVVYCPICRDPITEKVKHRNQDHPKALNSYNPSYKPH